MTGEPPADEALACRQAFLAAMTGEQPLTWDAWKWPIYDSTCLTPQGRVVALRATDTLQRFLGVDFLQRVLEAGIEHPLVSPFGGIWPANKVPWVYANLFQMMAQLELLGNHARPLRQTMRRNFQHRSWTHSLLQLGVGSLGLQAGWQSAFEPALRNGRRADVLLTAAATNIIVETVAMGISESDLAAQTFFHQVSWRLSALELQYIHAPVQLTGSLGYPLPPEETEHWLSVIAEAARLTAEDGSPRQILSDNEGFITVTKGSSENGTKLTSAPVTSDIWGRLIARLNDKNQQIAGAPPAWVRLEEMAGLWHFTALQPLALGEKLARIAPLLQQELAAFPNLAGVILSPAVLLDGRAIRAEHCEQFVLEEGTALQCPLPTHRVRETLIIPRLNGPVDDSYTSLVHLYAQEDTWLDWALNQLGLPPFHLLVHEE